MIEVFKTDIGDPKEAKRLVDLICHAINHCEANFDLEDCDRVLRVECKKGSFNSLEVIEILNRAGFQVEVMEDDISIQQL